jgi:threonine synthase
VLYPEGRVSPTQEAQLTIFNGEENGNVRAYALAGSFDDCHRLTREAFADRDLRAATPLTSANSVNVGRLLPQMIYYFHGAAQLAHGIARTAAPAVFCTPSGNFGNLTAGLMARRAGLPVARFVAATNVNDVIPQYLATGRFEPRASVRTIANAMDVGSPSNFERMLWLYDGDIDAMRRDVAASVHTDSDVRETIRRVYETHGYLLDPHSAIAYRGVREAQGSRVFLATAHPAKFAEIVEPIIGRRVDMPPALADAVQRPRRILPMPATYDAVREAVRA